MYLTGQYDLYWNSSMIFLANLSNEQQAFSIKFHDRNGGIVHETNEQKIKPFGSEVIRLAKISKIQDKSGLFIINCGVGISGEYRYIGEGPLRSVVPLKEGLPPFSLTGSTVFISYAMRKENATLYDLVSRFMKAMGFTVVSASESGRPDVPPGTQISKMIGESNALLAVLTKDIESPDSKGTKFHPSPNVVDEIGQAAGKPTILIVEEGTEIPSNIQTRATYTNFDRSDYGGMLVNLIENVRKTKLI